MACNPCDVSSMLIGARNSGFPTVPLVLGVKWGPAHAAGIGNGGDRRTKLAGGEGVEPTAFALSMDGPSEGRSLQEILPLGVDGGEKGGRDRASSSVASIGSSGVCSEDLFRQENLNHMSGFVTLHKTQEAARDETTDGPARRVAAEADAARKPRNRKPEAGLAFQTAMAHEI